MAPKLIALSFNRLRDLQCPCLFYRKHIAKTYIEPETPQMATGREIAEFLRQYRGHCYSAGVYGDDTWLDTRMESMKWTEPERAREIVRNFKGSEFRTVPLEARCVMIERKWAFDCNLNPIMGKEADAWYAPGVAFRIIADFAWRSADTLRVIDDKTGHGENDPLQLQLAGYFLYRAVPPIEAGGLHHVHGTFNVLSTPPRREDCEVYRVNELNWVGDFVRDKIDRANSRDWEHDHEPEACDLCRTCRMRDCPIRQEGLSTALAVTPAPSSVDARQFFAEIAGLLDGGSLQSREQAEKLLLFRLQLDNLYDRTDGMLRSWVEGNDPVHIAGMVAKLDDEERWRVDLGPLLDSLIAYGASREAILKRLSLTRTNLEKLISEAGLRKMRPLLEPYVSRTVYRKFKVVKDKF